MQRDAIYTALQAQLETLSPVGVAVVSRGFVSWDVAELQPAIYMVPVTESPMPYKRGFPNIFIIKVDLYLYNKWSDSIEQGARDQALLMDAVEALIAPGGPYGGINPCAGLVNTLGGLVNYCALQGTAEISLGFLNQNQCIARMPVEIEVPQ